MIKIYDQKQNCTGCTACMMICRQKAIKMQADKEGFLYPYIDLNKCINCGLCGKICPMKKKPSGKIPLKMAAVKHSDENIRADSTSGGMFTAISDLILDKKGYIIAAGYDVDMNVIHKTVNTKYDRNKLRNSKYVQSTLNNVFCEAQELLNKGEYVLFVGTPCQVAGLRSYLRQDYQKLLLCDIVCHAVPSPLLWNEHIKLCEKVNAVKIIKYFCRTKIKGWHSHVEMQVYQDNSIDFSSGLSQIHKNLFYSELPMRPSCYTCQYANMERVADITIGDCWGIEKWAPDFDDNKGISLVMLNTARALNVFSELKDIMIWRDVNIDDCMQPQLQHPIEYPTQRKEFWDEYHKFGYVFIAKKYGGYGWKNTMKNKIAYYLEIVGLYKIIKRLLNK